VSTGPRLTRARSFNDGHSYDLNGARPLAAIHPSQSATPFPTEGPQPSRHLLPTARRRWYPPRLSFSWGQVRGGDDKPPNAGARVVGIGHFTGPRRV